MALSKSTRILILIAIDTGFFLLELIVGSAVHSLALVADSFHMLNDVLSLCVGYWAVTVAHQKQNSKMYTYGWQRAETLGALVNGVFLVALCLSIFLEAVQRFFEPTVVSNPLLVLIVGCCGLGSNILGLFLFHEHGHSHGGGTHGHSHGTGDPITVAEEGNSRSIVGGHTELVADESGNIADVLPQAAVGGWLKPRGMETSTREESAGLARRGSKPYTKSDEDDSTVANSTLTKSTSPLSQRKSNASSAQRRHRRRQNSGASRSRFSSIEDLNIHPASFRNDIIAASRLEDIESQAESGSERDDAVSEHSAHEDSPLLRPKNIPGHSHTNGHAHIRRAANGSHATHKHSQAKEAEISGHSHSDLNMRGVFLHVMGDALGNIGVIASALIIWLTTWSGRYYADPAISLVITVIILTSAIPLCKAASKILLQAVPDGIDVDDIKDDIEEISGIISCHHLHVWQLSDVKLVASLHVQVDFDFKGEGSARYMAIAKEVRHCLHEYGIHSSTIQPEFCLDSEHNHASANASDHEGGGTPRPKSKGGSKTASLRSGAPETCLLECGDECGEQGQCCAPAAPEGSGESHEGHSH